MVSKLTFKGDKTKKRKKLSSGDLKSKNVKSLPSNTKHSEPVLVDARSWVFAEDVQDISGPVMFASVCLFFLIKIL